MDPADQVALEALQDLLTATSVQPNNTSQSEVGDGLSALQDILVRPELLEFRQRLQQMEHKIAELETQMARPAELIKLIVPLLNTLLQRQFSDLKGNVADQLQPIANSVQSIEKQVEQERSIAISVRGVKPGLD